MLNNNAIISRKNMIKTKSNWILIKGVVMLTSLFVFNLGSLYCQNPGGVSANLTSWFKANTSALNLTTTGNSVSKWNSEVNSYSVSQSVAAKQPQLINTINPNVNFNFNPSIQFNKALGYGLANISGTPDVLGNTGTYFIVINAYDPPGTTSSTAFTYASTLSYRYQLKPSFRIQTGAIGTGYTADLVPAYPASYPTIAGRVLGSYSTGSNFYSKRNSERFKLNNTASLYNPSIGVGMCIGCNFNSGGAEATNSAIAEVITYNTTLDTASINKVESYLAIKYGITLNQYSIPSTNSYPTNYTASDGSIIWSASANKSFDSCITGIGRDDASGLLQLQSMSVNNNALVSIYNDNTAGVFPSMNANNVSSILIDKSFLIFGDNGLSTNLSICSINGKITRMPRVWKALKTGAGIGQTTLAVDAASIPSGAKNIIISSDSTFPMSLTTIYPLTSINGKLYAPVILGNNSFFTFATDTVKVINTIVQPTCSNPSAGSISVAVSGGAAPFSYSWNTTPVQTTNTLSNIPGGVYTLTITMGIGCVSNYIDTVVSSSSVLIIAHAFPDTICAGSSTQLSVTSIGGNLSSYNWLPVGKTGASISVTPINTTTYTVFGTDSLGCSDTAKITVVVNALPKIGSITGSNFVCIGQTVTLNDTTLGGIWKSLIPGIATINSSGIVKGIKAGIDTIRFIATNKAGCTDSLSIPFTVNGLPVISPISGDSILCVGKTTTLTNSTIGGVWLSTNPAIASISNGGSVKGISIGVDSIRYIVTNSNGCSDSTSLSFTIKVQPIVAPITGSNTVCVGKNISLSETTTGGVWSSDFNTIATIINGMVTGVFAGTDTVRYKVVAAGGCSDSALFVVTVNSLPKIAAITGSNAICIAKKTTLINTTGGGTWLCSNTSIATIDINGVVTAISSGIDTIRYIVTNSNGCLDSVFFPITVNSLPSISPISGNSIICVGSTTLLSESTVGGVWVNKYPVIASLNNTGAVKGLVLGIDTIGYIVTNSYGCTDSVFIAITVNSLPVISPINGINSVCIGKSTTLFDATTGGTWVNTNPTVATLNGGGNITGNVAGIDTIRYIVKNGCTDSVFTILTVKALPVISAIAGLDSVCVSKTIVLADTINGGVWVSSNSSMATIDNAGTVTGILGGTVTVRYIVTNLAGCTDSVSKSIVVVTPLIAPIAGINNICIGTTTILTNGTVGGVWSSTNLSMATVSGAGLVAGLKAGTTTIIYTVNNSIGCANQVIMPFTVNALPVIPAIVGGNSVCVGKSLLLNNASTYTGVWYSSYPTIASINAGTVTGNTVGATNIKYVVTDGNGCIDSTGISFTVKAFPTANFTLPKNICLPDGNGQFVNTSTIPAGALAVNYSWNFNDPNDLAISTVLSPIHHFSIPIQQPTYTIKLTVTADGCAVDTSIVMLSSIIHNAPIAGSLIVPASGEVCLNNPVIFYDNSPQSIYKSIWYLGDGTIDTSFNISYVYPFATSYFASHAVMDSNGCISVNKDQIHIVVDPYPIVDAGFDKYLLQGDSIVLTPTVSGNSLSYLWTPSTNLNDASIFNPVCTATSDITYTLKVTSKNGCESSSNIKVFILGTIGIPNVFSPNGDGMHETWVITNISKYPGVSVKVFNRYGQLVYNSIGYGNAWDGKFNGSPLPFGTYFYVIEPGNGAQRLSGWVEIIR